MKKFSIILFSVFFLLGCAASGESHSQVLDDSVVEIEESYVSVPTTGKKIPQFDGLLGSDGELHNLSDFEGAPLLLLFETEHCHYCDLERPGWIELLEEYPYLQIVTVAVGEEIDRITEFVEEEKLPYLWLAEGDQFVSITYLVNGTPDHFLIDADGILRARYKGYLTKDRLEAALKEHIFFSQSGA